MNTPLAPAPATTGVGFNEYADRGSSMAAARAMADACPNLAARRGAMELLAPAGGMEQLEYALHFGADAVYMAGQRFGMRRRADNFTEEELAQAVAKAHGAGARAYVTVNTLMNDGDMAHMPEYFDFLAQIGADAAIVSDMGALRVARRVAPGLELHLSTQASCMNAESALGWYDLGVKRVVVAREMSLAQIAQMRRQIPDDLEIEAFVHGAMCMAYSGRCLISDHLAARRANIGHCAQPCRWKYYLVEETRPGEYFPVEQDDHGSFIMSSNDMNMLSYLDELAAAGVNSLKIEGRAKGAYYVASVVNAYRHVLDGCPADQWQEELETTSHRPYNTGFYFGPAGQNHGTGEYCRKYQMVARGVEAPAAAPAQEAEGPRRAHVLCRNRFFEGETLEVVSPGQPVRQVTVTNLIWHADPNADWAEVEKKGQGRKLGPDPACPATDTEPSGSLVQVTVANRTMNHYSFDAPFAIKDLDILRIERSGLERGRVIDRPEG